MNFGDEFGLQRKPRRVAEINLINMIDMLFFLLVFFVLTSSFICVAQHEYFFVPIKCCQVYHRGQINQPRTHGN